MVASKFEELGRKIWDDINNANKYNLQLGEETISDNILLQIARQNYFNIRILQTTKPKEAIQGTDWEWYVGSYKYGWIRFAFQAKRLNLMDGRYQNLNHNVGIPPNQELQLTLLKTFATANNAVPLYTFYNYYPKATMKHWHCTESFEMPLLGWTFTPLHNVETALQNYGWRTFDRIHQFEETLPIRCLFAHFRANYEDKSKNPQDFLGESYKKIYKLPPQLINAIEIGILNDFPEQLYKPEIKIYPKRIAIIDIEN